jgi:hypothetical protein
MKKKHATEQYAAKPKTVPKKLRAKVYVHPALSVTDKLLRWLKQGEVPLSVILLHGLYLARAPVNDGLPIDTIRPEFKMQGTDNKVISEILDALARPQADKYQVIASWLQSVWIKKPPGKLATLPPNKDRKIATLAKDSINPTGNHPVPALTKPVIVVKKTIGLTRGK